VSYQQVALAHHRALWEAGVQIDVIAQGDSFDGYDVVVAPLLHLLKDDTAERLSAVVARGGTVLSGALSGRVDEDTNAYLADIPGPLAPLFQIRVEETDSLPIEQRNRIDLSGVLDDATAPELSAHSVFEVIVPEGAEVVGRYSSEFYAGSAAITRAADPTGGSAWYVGTLLDPAGLAHVVRAVLNEHDLVGPYADQPELEFAVRAGDGGRIAFLLNHSDSPVTVPAHATGTELLTGRDLAEGELLTLAPKDVLVIREA
ncbi:MAG: beta-galactosidase trimerization domain-containing protein, partial [Mycetocola sp.]